jgi:predicted glycosyltransferase
VLERAGGDERVHAVVLARTDPQRAAVRALELDRVVVPERTVDGRSLVALADVLVSAGGTMNREAAVLGTPVWSMFEGPLGGVDEQLVREGRLKLLTDAGQIVFEPKPQAALRDRVRRDPTDLLRLALPGLA